MLKLKFLYVARDIFIYLPSFSIYNLKGGVFMPKSDEFEEEEYDEEEEDGEESEDEESEKEEW